MGVNRKRVEKHNFSTRNKKNRVRNTKKQEKQETSKKNTRNTETRQDKIWQDKICVRRDFDKISRNGENGNENEKEVF